MTIYPFPVEDAKRSDCQHMQIEMTKNIAMQILPDQKVLQLVSGRSLIAPEIPRYAGAFINGLDRPDIRIDFTQHCLSALIKTRGYQ